MYLFAVPHPLRQVRLPVAAPRHHGRPAERGGPAARLHGPGDSEGGGVQPLRPSERRRPAAAPHGAHQDHQYWKG